MGVRQILWGMLSILKKYVRMALMLSFFPNIVSLATYVLFGAGLYTVVRKRGIAPLWLAWVPLGNLWLLICISDHYHRTVRGQTRNRRRSVVKLMIAIPICTAASLLTFGIWLLTGLLGLQIAAAAGLIATALSMAALAGCVAAILILCILCYWDLYVSCDPAHGRLYTVLTAVSVILCLPIVPAFLIFRCRDKEEGMPGHVIDT